MRTPIVLMYHDVGTGGLYTLETCRFRKHVEVIRALGVPAVRAGDLPRTCGPAVVITFDDGARGVVERALPILADAKLNATLFMTAGDVGSDRWCSADHLRSWCEAGNELGSHGYRHETLTAVPKDRAMEDLVRSKDVLENIVGQEVRAVSFPNGRLSRSLVVGAAEVGLTVAFGSWPGYGVGRSGAYGRFAILDRTSDDSLRSVLKGSGAFAYAPQRALFVFSRLIGEPAYIKFHNLLQRIRSPA